MHAAQAGSDLAVAAGRAARLRLAGRLRDHANQLDLAQVEWQHAVRQQRLLKELSADVDRRVKAGELARADAMAAKAEMLAAQSLAQGAFQELEAQRNAWTLLTGLTAAAGPEIVEAAADPELDQHPEAQLAAAAVERARRRLDQVQAQGSSSPELGLGVRRERGGVGEARENSVAVSLRLPFGSDAQQAPQVATALHERDLALANQRRLHLQLEAELAQTRGQLASGRARVEAEAERAVLLQQRAELLKQSYEAGESSLPELLRAVSQAAQAAAALARQQNSLRQAQARVQQALGQLP